MRRTRSWSRERGTQIAEMAVVLPLLVFLTLVVVEGAAFVRVHQVLNNAAREGARLASAPENQNQGTTTTTEITNVVRQYAFDNGAITSLNDPNLTVSINQNRTITTGSGVNMLASRVTVTYPYQLKYLPNLPFFNVQSPINLQGSAEFLNLY